MESPMESQVAIVYDYDSLASFRIQRQSILLDCQGEMTKLYKAFYDVNVPVDVIPASGDITDYKVVILPQMIIARPEFQERVKAFVDAGGTLVLTYRNAVKDTDNNLPFGETVPVGYGELAGVSVTETESLQEVEAFPVVGQNDFAGTSGQGGIFRDMLEVKDAQVLYSYGDAFYGQYAAVTRKHHGKGMVYYLGCALDEAVTGKIMGKIMEDNQIETIPSEEGVEVVLRGGDNQRVRMIINHNAAAASFGDVELEPFGCQIMEI